MAAKRPTGAYPKSSKKFIAKARFKDAQKNGRVLSGEVITPGSAIRLGAKALSATQKAIVGRAVRENVLEKTAQRVGPKAKPMLRKVSDEDAKEIAKEMNKRPGSNKAMQRLVPRGGTGLSRSERSRVSVKEPVTIKKGPSRKSDVIKKRTDEKVLRTKRFESMAKPPKPKGPGKSIAGPKRNPRTVTVVRPSTAAERAKKVNPGDRRIDASRKQGMEDAITDSRNTFKPLNKSPYQRELEQVRDKGVRTPRPDKYDSSMAEADRRVEAGIRNQKYQKGESGKFEPAIKGRKPDMPNSRKLAEAARNRPGLTVRKQEALKASRKKAIAAMNRKNLTPEQRKIILARSTALAKRVRRDAMKGKRNGTR
jgi:hypothetical protein